MTQMMIAFNGLLAVKVSDIFSCNFSYWGNHCSYKKMRLFDQIFGSSVIAVKCPRYCGHKPTIIIEGVTAQIQTEQLLNLPDIHPECRDY
jgi:hypothetical protein